MMKKATFGSGCFWCVEGIFKSIDGVEEVYSGYMGGARPNPSYEQVCTGATGHAEVIQFVYDEEKVSFEILLEVFWKTHDPTTLNRQGADIGTQYRSVVFYHDPEQAEKAEAIKAKLNEAQAFENPVVTEIAAASEFYPAEDYHQDYFLKNPNNAYCQAVARPKLEKFKRVFADLLKA